MAQWLRLAFFVISLSLLADDQDAFKRVQAHILVRDLQGALQEVRAGAQKYPTSKSLKESEILVLSRIGQDKAALAAWDEYVKEFSLAYDQRDLIEEMAWGVIWKGCRSPSPQTRGIAMLAAHFSNSARGVAVLNNHLQDPNSLVRTVAVQLAASMHDEKLKKSVYQIFKRDSVWAVRLEAIKAVGQMKIEESQDDLKSLIASSSSTMEEKAAAIQSLVHLMDGADREDIEHLTASGRIGLKLLACEVVAQFELTEAIDLIIPLLYDTSADVKQAALQVIGILSITSHNGYPIEQWIRPLMSDTNPQVAIYAAWALTLSDSREGKEALQRWLSNSDKEVRLLAAGCLKATGSHATTIIEQAFNETLDPMVRLNLALGLLGQRKEVENACDVIYAALMEDNCRWQWTEQGIFRFVAPSTVRYKEEIPQYPEVVNQMVRLELIQILAFLNDKRAHQAMRQFLKGHVTGVTGMTAALLLTEGDEEAVDLVRDLLDDPDPDVKTQATLILALWGKDEEVIGKLKTLYESSDRGVQEKVLEGIGHVASTAALPFLVEKLKEPHQHLRMIAASSIIQCLNR